MLCALIFINEWQQDIQFKVDSEHQYVEQFYFDTKGFYQKSNLVFELVPYSNKITHYLLGYGD